MTLRDQEPLDVCDLAPQREQFLRDVLAGLRSARKTLGCKYFYDADGSRLFDRICELPEYYLTRTEHLILTSYANDICDALGETCLLVEFGSGSSLKTRIVLDHLRNPAAYLPIDISRSALSEASISLSERYPDLRIHPICADYTQQLALPNLPCRRKVIFFPGSTIGNFEPHEAVRFLRRCRAMAGPGSALLIGVDLKKDPAILHAAYNDAAGVTAQFNLNLLIRINAELGGNFDPARFAHYAYYNPRLGRIEMHLLSLRNQCVRIGHERIDFAEGESIFTESSYKYTIFDFENLASEAGYHLERAWLDPHRLFSVQYFL
jgi:dimethylhistidine N-methyltransferase